MSGQKMYHLEEMFLIEVNSPKKCFEFIIKIFIYYKNILSGSLASIANMYIFNGCCYTFADPSNRIYVPNITKDVNINVSNTIIRINKSKAFTKHALFECKCKLNGTKCNSN